MDVLLVEDDPSIREMLPNELSDAGLAVATAASAEAGLLAAREEQDVPRVLVTDVNLGPGMDGFGLASEVRKRWPSVVVLIMTGRPENVDRHVPNASAVFIKPFEPAKLVTAVVSALDDTSTPAS